MPEINILKGNTSRVHLSVERVLTLGQAAREGREELERKLGQGNCLPGSDLDPVLTPGS